MVAVALSLAFMLSLFHFLSELYLKHVKKYQYHLISFGAGMFITFIFLFILPEVFSGAGALILGSRTYILLLLGFLTYHLIEKYIYQHPAAQSEKRLELSELHILGFSVEHIAIGMSIAFAFAFSNRTLLASFLIIVPLVFYILASALAMKRLIIKSLLKKPLLEAFIAFTIVLGVIIVAVLKPAPEILFSLFAYLTGALLYVTIVDIVPKKGFGQPVYFTNGVFVGLAVLMLASYFA